MNGLKFRYRPVDEVIREMENCGSRTISINDADFFGTQERPMQMMRALRGRGIKWQAGVTSKLAQDDRMLELAAESGCTMLSIGFESISRETLKSVHKHVNRPDTFAALVEKVHSYGIMVFGLFMFGFDGDDASVFRSTLEFNIDAKYDACAFSTLTPYPGTLTWYELKKANRIVSFDWSMYDQGHVVYRPARMSAEELRIGMNETYHMFYSLGSIARRFPLAGLRHRAQWLLYNAFMRRAVQTEIDAVAAATAEPECRRCLRSCRLNASGGRPFSKPRKGPVPTGADRSKQLCVCASTFGTTDGRRRRSLGDRLGALEVPDEAEGLDRRQHLADELRRDALRGLGVEFVRSAKSASWSSHARRQRLARSASEAARQPGECDWLQRANRPLPFCIGAMSLRLAGRPEHCAQGRVAINIVQWVCVVRGRFPWKGTKRTGVSRANAWRSPQLWTTRRPRR
jgi:hypothetical protein